MKQWPIWFIVVCSQGSLPCTAHGQEVPKPDAAQTPPAQAVRPSLWIDPIKLDLTDEKAAALLLRVPTDRLIVPFFTSGQTLSPTGSDLFRQHPLYENKPDALAILIRQAHKKKKRVYALIDCLNWSPSGLEKAQDVLERRPDLAERSRDGGFGTEAAGKYASPFNPEVRLALRRVVEELVARHPQLDGLVLQCQLPSDALLGFSRSAVERFNLVRPMGVKPFPEGRVEGDEKQLAAWRGWRGAETSDLVRELSGAFSSGSRGTVTVVGQVDWLLLDSETRNRTLEDWPTWMSSGYVDEVLLHCPVAPAEFDEDYLSSLSQLGIARKPVRLSPLLYRDEAKSVADLGPALKRFDSLSTPHVVLKVSESSDFEPAVRAAAGTRPRTPPLVPKPPLTGLRADPQLQVPFTVNLKNPTVDELLRRFHERTGIRLTLHSDITGDRVSFGSLSLHNAPAWVVMEELRKALTEDGEWEKTADGYRLIGKVKPVSGKQNSHSPPVPPSRGWHLWVILGHAAVLGVALGVLGVRYHRRKARRLLPTDRPPAE
jgi:hypothetical protein